MPDGGVRRIETFRLTVREQPEMPVILCHQTRQKGNQNQKQSPEKKPMDFESQVLLGIAILMIVAALILGGVVLATVLIKHPKAPPEPIQSTQKSPWPDTPDKTEPVEGERQLSSCALATAVLAASQGRLTLGQDISLVYVRLTKNNQALMTQIQITGPNKTRIYSQPTNGRCSNIGIVTIGIHCSINRCMNLQTGGFMTKGRAQQMVRITPDRHRKRRGVSEGHHGDFNRLMTTQWQSNMFYKWLNFSARQVSNKTCVACYNAKRLPRVRPLPGSQIGSCPDIDRCFARCAMYMAGGVKLRAWSRNRQECPEHLNTSLVNEDFPLPPVVKIPDDVIFPFCIVKGKAIRKVVARDTPDLTDPKGLVQCSNITWFPPNRTGTGNKTAYIKLCKTTNKARIKCQQLVINAKHIIYEMNDTVIHQYPIPDYTGGTAPLGDIFWICEEGEQIRSHLTRKWTGICAPTMLTGKLTILAPPAGQENRLKRDTSQQWEADSKVYVSWDQVPYGVPTDHAAIDEGWIGGNIPLVGNFANALGVSRNSRWVNYLWYNQQRFINYTIQALEGMREQLHAVSLMALQNRFVLETLLAEDQDVCQLIGEECCTVIPMHTGEGGNVTKALTKLKNLREEHVMNSNWNTGADSFWNWLKYLSWSKFLKGVGLVLAGILLLILTTACCIVPLVSMLVKKISNATIGQFLVNVERQGTRVEGEGQAIEMVEFPTYENDSFHDPYQSMETFRQ